MEEVLSGIRSFISVLFADEACTLLSLIPTPNESTGDPLGLLLTREIVASCTVALFADYRVLFCQGLWGDVGDGSGVNACWWLLNMLANHPSVSINTVA